MVDVVVSDENLHASSSWIERLVGPVAKAIRPLAQGRQFECRWALAIGVEPIFEPIVDLSE